jgi:uncharacterized membrane protein YidH (DUF202 family)
VGRSGSGGGRGGPEKARALGRGGAERIVPTNLRLSLTIFQLGFAIDSASGFAALLTHASQLPFHGLILLLTPVFSVFGILFLWIGRHEWNELHRARVRYTNLAFAVSLVAIALAAAPVAYLVLAGGPTPSGWLLAEFGAAIALVFAVTFVTYALVVAHLVARLGEILMALGLGWAALVSAAIGIELSPSLGEIVKSISQHSTSIGTTLSPITLLDALLGFSYLAFFLAFTDAHYRVSRGLAPS